VQPPVTRQGARLSRVPLIGWHTSCFVTPVRTWALGFLLCVGLAAVGCKEEGTIRVRSLKLVGVSGVKESALKNVLATRQSSRLPWGTKRFFDRAQFEADMARVRAFYADRGYPNARVTGFDVDLSDTRDSVALTVTIEEGEPLRVAALEFSGFDVLSQDDQDALKQKLPLEVGVPRDRQAVVTIHELAVNALRDHGYPYAAVEIQETPVEGREEVSLTFIAQPGPQARFGEIEIAGNKSVSDRVVRRALSYQQGGLYRRSLTQETQRRLYDTQLFQFANVEPLNVASQPREVPTRVTVVEGPDYRVRFAAGYGTEEKARAEADYHHLNFLGGARSAGVRGRWSALDRGVRLDVVQPYFFRPRLSLNGEGKLWRTKVPAYDADTLGATVTLAHRTGRRRVLSMSLASEQNRTSIAPNVLGNATLRDDLIALGLDPDTGEQRGTLTALLFDAQFLTADEALNARSGYRLAFHGELAGGLLPGTFAYQSLSADARYYLPLGERFVVASRLQAGNIAPRDADVTNVPFSKKYFLGGATTVRGWGVYQVSPLSSGLSIGGNSMLGFNAEVRATVSGNLGAVVFLDGGNVWANSGDIAFGDLKYAAGAGLRYRTPIGPARFDFGHQLNRIPGLLINGEPETRHWRVHFSIGQAF
jgi:outer membrane protein insertion porin family